MDDVQHLLASGESQTVEFKKSTASLRDAIETLCAFANQHGGYVIFGVDDHGTVVGQHVSDDTLQNIANTVKLNTDPKLYPTLEQVDIDGKSCILVTIEESPLKPHLAMAAPIYVLVQPTSNSTASNMPICCNNALTVTALTISYNLVPRWRILILTH